MGPWRRWDSDVREGFSAGGAGRQWAAILFAKFGYNSVLLQNAACVSDSCAVTTNLIVEGEQSKNMQMFESQRIRDPIHNLISFEADQFENAMWEALCSAPFQRLRRIKQLGFSDLVYPGATHSRFAHSVGVFHTARQLMQIIYKHEGEQGFQHSSAQIALAAALVHDVGHGPFSHAFEAVGKRLDLKLANHEFVSDRLIRDSELSEPLKILGSGFHNDVADVIGSAGPRSIYDAVVTSQFDADRLDYMRRDRMMAGSSHGVIDYDWLIGNLEVGTVPVGVDDVQSGVVQTFVVGPKAVLAAEAYVLGLFQLYPTIYFHKATRGAEKLFTELMVRVFMLAIDGSFGETGLPENHPIIKFANAPTDLNLALQLDDTVVWGALSQIADGPDKLCSEYARRLLDRKLLRCFDLRENIKKQVRETASPDDIRNLTDRISGDIVLVWTNHIKGLGMAHIPRMRYIPAPSFLFGWWGFFAFMFLFFGLCRLWVRNSKKPHQRFFHIKRG